MYNVAQDLAPIILDVKNLCLIFFKVKKKFKQKSESVGGNFQDQKV